MTDNLTPSDFTGQNVPARHLLAVASAALAAPVAARDFTPDLSGVFLTAGEGGLTGIATNRYAIASVRADKPEETGTEYGGGKLFLPIEEAKRLVAWLKKMPASALLSFETAAEPRTSERGTDYEGTLTVDRDGERLLLGIRTGDRFPAMSRILDKERRELSGDVRIDFKRLALIDKLIVPVPERGVLGSDLYLLGDEKRAPLLAEIVTDAGFEALLLVQPLLKLTA